MDREQEYRQDLKSIIENIPNNEEYKKGFKDGQLFALKQMVVICMKENICDIETDIDIDYIEKLTKSNDIFADDFKGE